LTPDSSGAYNSGNLFLQFDQWYAVYMTADAAIFDTIGTAVSKIDPNISVNGPLADDVDILFSPGIGNGVSAVPEPSTWAMMLIGFAGLGFAGYRSAKKSGAALAATPEDLFDALAFALRYSGCKRVDDAAKMAAAIVAQRLVEHL